MNSVAWIIDFTYLMQSATIGGRSMVTYLRQDLQHKRTHWNKIGCDRNTSHFELREWAHEQDAIWGGLYPKLVTEVEQEFQVFVKIYSMIMQPKCFFRMYRELMDPEALRIKFLKNR